MALSKPIRYVTFNVDQAQREQLVPGKTWDERAPGVLDVIRESKADILCIQEMRNLTTSKMTVDEFAAKITRIYPNFASVIWYYNDSAMPFAGACFYDRMRFRVIRSERLRYDTETGKEMDVRSHLFIEFENIETKKTFHVVNVHPALGEEHKWKAINELIRRFSCVFHCARGPTIISGDFNLFDDREGVQMREELQRYWTDMAYPLVHKRSDGSEHEMSGTFFGFEHDEFHRPLDAMSRLDHIFTDGFKKVSNAEFINVDNAPLQEDRSYPSDHVCIAVDLVPVTEY